MALVLKRTLLYKVVSLFLFSFGEGLGMQRLATGLSAHGIILCHFKHSSELNNVGVVELDISSFLFLSFCKAVLLCDFYVIRYRITHSFVGGKFLPHRPIKKPFKPFRIISKMQYLP